MKLNEHYANLQENYLFAEIDRRVGAWQEAHPGERLIRLGIGDVTLPLAPAVVEAMQAAAAELGAEETFRGYGPYQGYAFLREAVSAYYREHGVIVPAEDVFVSDGAKSDVGNILDLFDADNTVLIPDPVYPVYVDTNVMAGRRIVYLDANEGNGFLPLPDPAVRADLIYLCSPNNPTGAVYDRAGLGAWVEYARRQNALILFDAAYEAFVADPALPRSIYEIEGAKDCAIEFCSLSKTAGFTGVRCGYTVIPRTLLCRGQSLHAMWLRRQATKSNGVSYVVQRGAAAALGGDGLAQSRRNLACYRENARILAEALRRCGIWFAGGENAPYLWMRCPNGKSAWAYFDALLAEKHIVGTPGAGFGRNGEGYFRLTAFGSREDTQEAARRMAQR